jgi:DNA mismatch endonuclease, patch repair protein
MARNRGTNTKPEVLLRKACFAIGMRYILNSKLPGRPDFVFLGSKVAVFVDGCFWHGCPTHYQAPATRSEFWQDKLWRNRARDSAVTRQLTQSGWQVVRIWEHTVKSDLTGAVSRIKAATE